MKYRPEIDGLRAIAIIPVLLFHYDASLLPGGFLGVDVFFVISGYLITSIILKEYDKGDFSFASFWLRRVRRILPALITMVVVTLVVGSQILYAADVNILANHGLASLLSFANISHWIMAGNYWGPSAESSPFLHAWSLSVEEQFYLFFPLFLFLVLRFQRARLILIFSILSLCSFLLFIFASKIYSSATFYLLPTRAWELGAGSLLAMFSFQKINSFKIRQSLSFIGLSVVVTSYFLISGNEGLSPYIFFPVFGAALIIFCSNDSNGLVNKLLSNTILTHIGKISYSLYLWHWPILVLHEQIGFNGDFSIHPLILFTLIFFVSFISYKFIEVPTRRNTRLTPFILIFLLSGVGLSLYFKNFEYSEDTSKYGEVLWHGELYNVNPRKEWPESVKKRMKGITVIRQENEVPNNFINGIHKLYGDEKSEILVLGNSHALMWAKVLDEVAETLNVSISFYTADGTPTFFDVPPKKAKTPEIFFSIDEKYKFDEARYRVIEERKPKVVVIADPWYTQNREKTLPLIHFITKIGSKILFIEQPPVLFFGDKNAPQYLSYLGLVPNKSSQSIRHMNSLEYNHGLKLVEQLTSDNNLCRSISVADLFIRDDQVVVLEQDKVLYIDDDHLSYAGALKVKNRIIQSLRGLLKK